jgi:hypothetical protein
LNDESHKKIMIMFHSPLIAAAFITTGRAGGRARGELKYSVCVLSPRYHHHWKMEMNVDGAVCGGWGSDAVKFN